MIEIKQSRKLHESGYRLMEISYSDANNQTEIINHGADVLHIGFKNWLDGLHLDITKKGVIRIWSNDNKLIPERKYKYSDSVFMVGEEIEQ